MNSPNSSALRSPYLDERARKTPLVFQGEVCPQQPSLSLPGAGCGRGGTRAGLGHHQEQFWGGSSSLANCFKSVTQSLRKCINDGLADREEQLS